MRTEPFSNAEPTARRMQRSGIGSADFLLLEARTADAYLDLAQRSFDEEARRRSVSRARRALTAMTYFLAECAGDVEDAQLIRRIRDDLRVRLNEMTR